SHPEIEHLGIRMRAAIQRHEAMDVDVFVDDQDVVRELGDLKRKWHIRDAWHARHIAFRFRIEGRTLFEVLLLLRQGPLLIWNVIALDDTLSRRHAESPGMILNIPRGSVERLPDAFQPR